MGGGSLDEHLSSVGRVSNLGRVLGEKALLASEAPQLIPHPGRGQGQPGQEPKLPALSTLRSGSCPQDLRASFSGVPGPLFSNRSLAHTSTTLSSQPDCLAPERLVWLGCPVLVQSGQVSSAAITTLLSSSAAAAPREPAFRRPYLLPSEGKPLFRMHTYSGSCPSPVGLPLPET